MNNKILNDLNRLGLTNSEKLERLLEALKLQLGVMKDSNEFTKKVDTHLKTVLDALSVTWTSFSLLYGIKEFYKETTNESENCCVNYLVFDLSDVESVMSYYDISIDALTPQEKIEALHEVQADEMNEDAFSENLMEYLKDNFPHLFEEEVEEEVA